jgi:hypothetical protein
MSPRLLARVVPLLEEEDKEGDEILKSSWVAE